MRITVNTNQLQEAIKKGQKAVSKKIAFDPVKSLLLRAEADKITLTAVNLDAITETTLTIELAGVIEIPGSTLLNINTLKLIEKIKNEDRVTITEEAITTKKRKIDFSSLAVEDFPEHERVCNIEAFNTNHKELLELLSIDYALSKEETRPLFTGIWIDKEAFIASDTHRLAKRDFKFVNNLEKQFVLNGFAVSLLNKQLLNKKSNSTVNVFASEDQQYIQFRTDNITLTVKGIAGTFPNWKQIIPQQFNTTVTINNKALQEEIDFLKEVAKNTNDALIFTVKDNKLSIKAKDDTNIVTAEIDATITGEELDKIAFNYKFLLDSLKANNNTEKIEFKLNNSLSPMVLENDLILPVRVA